MKKILIVRPVGSSGSPVYERSNSFSKYFEDCGLGVDVENTPDNFLSLLKLIKLIIINKPDYLFITMPPFRNWSLCLLPFIKVILDIRDGWSISMKGGYGGLVKPNSKKAFVARCIEYIAIKRSYATVTCTPGLKNYYSKLAKKKIYLVRNGISDHDFKIAQRYRRLTNVMDKERARPLREFVCAGKFSEYGKDKVKKVLSVINERYGQNKCIIHLIGSDIYENNWISEYIERNDFKNLSVKFSGRMDKDSMYKLMSDSFCAVTIIRDPSYDFGTKIYDYLALNLKYLDYFEEDNEYNSYFAEYSDLNNSEIKMPITIIREDILSESDFNTFFKGE